MKFKVGDKVRVKKGLEAGKKYGDIVLCKRMKVEEVITVDYVNEKGIVFVDGWSYSPEMLDLVVRSRLKNGYFCKDRSGGIFIWLYGQMVPNNKILADISFNDDLTSKSCTDCDIMEIRKPIPGLGYTIDELFENYDKMELVWKREPEVKEKAIEMLNNVISDCEKSIETNKSMIENARQTIRQIEEGDLDALL